MMRPNSSGSAKSSSQRRCRRSKRRSRRSTRSSRLTWSSWPPWRHRHQVRSNPFSPCVSASKLLARLFFLTSDGSWLVGRGGAGDGGSADPVGGGSSRGDGRQRPGVVGSWQTRVPRRPKLPPTVRNTLCAGLCLPSTSAVIFCVSCGRVSAVCTTLTSTEFPTRRWRRCRGSSATMTSSRRSSRRSRKPPRPCPSGVSGEIPGLRCSETVRLLYDRLRTGDAMCQYHAMGQRVGPKRARLEEATRRLEEAEAALNGAHRPGFGIFRSANDCRPPLAHHVV